MRNLSHQIPDDIQFEIIKILPVKSLLKFRTVSKSWKKFIDSREFIIERYRNTQHQRFLIRYYDDNYKYVSIADDDAFPENSFFLTPPQPIGELGIVIGSSLGLFCLFGPRDVEWEMNVAVIWNPTIKKTVTVSLPNVKYPFEGVFGFGVCPVTYDPKFVKLNGISVGKSTSFPWDVEVFTLSSGVWRRPLSNLPCKYIDIKWPRIQVVIDGIIYWSGVVRCSDSDTSVNVIVSFNLSNEVFREIHVPSCLAHHPFGIDKARESLVLFHRNMELEPNVLNVWMMDHGGSNSFTKISKIHVPYESVWNVMGFRKSNQLILEVDSELTTLEVYDPTEDASVEIEIYGDRDLYFVSSYTDSLLLLDQPEDV